MQSKKFKIEIQSRSPVLFCKYTGERDSKEDPVDFEKHTWKDRAHCNKDEVIIPGRMIQATLGPAGKLTGERVGGGKRGQGLSRHLAGVRIIGSIRTGVKKSKLKGHTAFVSATGKPDGPKVPRTYPQINKWKGVLEVQYFDIGILTPEVIVKYLNVAGQLIGVGHWRPGSDSHGEYGLFKAILKGKTK